MIQPIHLIIYKEIEAVAWISHVWVAYKGSVCIHQEVSFRVIEEITLHVFR